MLRKLSEDWIFLWEKTANDQLPGCLNQSNFYMDFAGHFQEVTKDKTITLFSFTIQTANGFFKAV